MRYENRTLARRVFMEPDVTFFRPLLTICKALSASPFEAGWYGAEVVCLMPLLLRNDSNSSLTKPVPLSVTIISGRPNYANIVRSSSMTEFDDVEGVHTASIHFE